MYTWNLGLHDSSASKEAACNAGDPGSIPGSGRSTGEGIGYPLQSAWASLVVQLVKNPPAVQETRVDPWVGKIPRRRERLPTPVFWPGEFHGLCSPWGRKELDTTEWLSPSLFPLPPQSNFSELSEMLSPGLQSSFCPKIKLNLQLSCCANFFQQVVKTAKIMLLKENQTSQVNMFHAFLCMERCKSLGSLKSFIWYAA